MNRFRKSSFAKITSIILAFIIFTTSCSDTLLNDQLPQSTNALNNCDKPFYGIDNYDEGAHIIENFIYVENDYNLKNSLDTKEKYYEHYLNHSSDNQSAIDAFALHSSKYKQLGHDGYLNYATNQGIISENVRNYMSNFKFQLDAFINNTHPSFEAFKGYIENKGLELNSNTLLCDYDKYVVKVYHVTLLGIGKYIYGTQFTNSSRSCDNFWQKLICGLSGTTVGVVVGTAVGAWKWVKSIFTGKKDGKEVNLIEALYQVYKISVDVWEVGTSFYDWCCDTISGSGIEKCGDPTGCWYTSSACNNYDINVVGPGLYTITNWNNGNTNPASTITPTPRLNVTIPNVQLQSIIQGTVLCTDEDGNSTRPFQFVRNIGQYYPLATPFWAVSPPTNATVNQSFQVIVGNPPQSGDLYTMSLSSSWGYSFNPITGGMFYFKALVAGQYWVEITYTSICTGEQKKTGQWVYIQ